VPLKIERQVREPMAHGAQELRESRQALPALENDGAVQGRVPLEDRRRRRLDRPGDPRLRPTGS
jgi:hypothetical protein